MRPDPSASRVALAVLSAPAGVSSVDTMQSAVLPAGQDVMPDATGAMGSVTGEGISMNQTTHYFVIQTAPASRAVQPCVKATSRDTERAPHTTD